MLCVKEMLDCYIADDQKKNNYEFDISLNEAFEKLDVMQVDIDMATLSKHYSMLIFTPATLITGRLQNGLEILREKGYEIRYLKPFIFEEKQIKELWKYQLHTFTTERWKEIVSVLTIGPSVLVFLYKKDIQSNSACQDLKLFKGVSDPLYNSKDSFRRLMGSMNKVVNFLHSSDDFLSVIRESYIILDPVTFCQLYTSLGNANSLDVDVEMAEYCIEFYRPEVINDQLKVFTALRLRLFWELRLFIEYPKTINHLLHKECAWVQNHKIVTDHDALKESFNRLYSPNEVNLQVLLNDVVAINKEHLQFIRIETICESIFILNQMIYSEQLIDLGALTSYFDSMGFFWSDWEKLILNTEEITKLVRLNP